jgi:hypothetical protein
MGVLSVLPLINAANVCCCLWVVSGGVVAAYVLQQNQPAPITPAEGAVVGLLAGLVGALVYLVLSIPLAVIMMPFQQRLLATLTSTGANLPPEVRDFMASRAAAGLGIVVQFIFMLVAGAIFSTIGGVIGAAVFKRQVPPAPEPRPPIA